MLWIGNKIPDYAKYSLENFRKINPTYKIEFIHIPLIFLDNIYNNDDFSFKYKNELKKSISYILDTKKNCYSDLINIQKHIYGKNIRFVQILSDIFRLEILNTYTGIYVDCDTYPIKPFDDQLLSYSFIASRYYKTIYDVKYSQQYIDNYFIGVFDKKIYNLEDENIKRLLETNINFESDIGYIYRKKQFYNMQLLKDDFNIGKNINSFYIEHYHANSWKLNTTKTSITPKCIYDKYL